jgi:hypothetical protein
VFGYRTRRLADFHTSLDQRLRLIAGAVPASDRVPGLHQPGHDQSAHRAQSHKPNIHDAYFLAFAGRQGRLSAIGRYWLLELGCQVRVSPLMILSNG